MSIDITAIKKEGVRKELFDKVGDALWRAKCDIESARETENAKFKRFNAMVLSARKRLDDAEALYAEFLKYSK